MKSGLHAKPTPVEAVVEREWSIVTAFPASPSERDDGYPDMESALKDNAQKSGCGLPKLAAIISSGVKTKAIDAKAEIAENVGLNHVK